MHWYRLALRVVPFVPVVLVGLLIWLDPTGGLVQRLASLPRVVPRTSADEATRYDLEDVRTFGLALVGGAVSAAFTEIRGGCHGA